MEELSARSRPRFGEAVRFWERRRAWYNATLFVVVLLWLGLTWPHFRPALTLDALGKMLVLALLANVCYCAAYLVEVAIQAASSDTARRQFRLAIWILGMLFGLLVENYWIADEIYPDVREQHGVVMPGPQQSPTRRRIC